jgi:hypothetical protein
MVREGEEREIGKRWMDGWIDRKGGGGAKEERKTR